MRGSLASVNEIYNHALKLLAGRDYSVSGLLRKLETRFGTVPVEVIDELLEKDFLNDHRYAENYVARRKRYGLPRLRAELEARGVSPSIVEDILSQTDTPSLRDALKATMVAWKLSAPVAARDAARLFRTLSRLGYDEDAIREAIEQLHDQQ
jgi:SOS response regulatory protein OraA/RecX